MSRKILLPMDGSQHSQRALDWYARHLNAAEDELIFAYVAEPPTGLVTDVITAEKKMQSAGDMGGVVAKARALAADVSRRCNELGVRARVRFLERLAHNTGQAIVELANEEAVDMILIGNRGIGLVKRAFLGSVSDYVLHHSHRTTVIVPPVKPAHH